MSRRGKGSESDGCLIALAFLVGIPLYLLTEHPIIFWFIFVPIVVFGISKVTKWFKK